VEPKDEVDQKGDRRLPASLRAVAYLSILFGLGSLVDFISSLVTHHKISFNLGIFQIPAGFGLLRLDQRWRSFSLFFIWCGFAGVLLCAAVLLHPSGGLSVRLLPYPAHDVSRATGFLLLAPAAIFLIWEYRVLTSERVRRLFGLTRSTAAGSRP
jgi:hypothetical protein